METFEFFCSKYIFIVTVILLSTLRVPNSKCAIILCTARIQLGCPFSFAKWLPIEIPAQHKKLCFLPRCWNDFSGRFKWRTFAFLWFPPRAHAKAIIKNKCAQVTRRLRRSLVAAFWQLRVCVGRQRWCVGSEVDKRGRRRLVIQFVVTHSLHQWNYSAAR